ncbi:MAG: TRAP transporter fused permease subunit [Cohaesibacter sp.]|nr:TRAP transporter fused permease subunit [Cohaesibacter sp.]
MTDKTNLFSRVNLDVALTAMASAYGLFHLYFSTLSTLSESWRNSIHVGGALVFLFIFSAMRQKKMQGRVPLFVLALLSVSLPIYVVGMEEALFQRGDELISADLVMAALAMFLVIVAAGVSGGWVLSLLALICVFYAIYFGALLPGTLGFRGISYETFAYRMFWGGEGYFGFLSSISATFVYLFILFGSVLLAAGSGDFLMRLALAVGSRLHGGPAQAAVIASALMGSVSGTSIGNVMATGSVTIPMMKRAGYSRRFAAGVEASASNIGQIAPPVMGAGAFILSAWTQVGYGTVVALSILPALLYFYSVFVSVACYTKRAQFDLSIEKVSIKWRNCIPFLAGIAVFISGLVTGYTPVYSCCAAIVVVIASSWLTSDNQITLSRLAGVFLDTARTASVTALMLAVANVIVGILTMSGKAITFSSLIFDAAQGNVYLMVSAVILISLILGMGLPITASYVIVAAVVGSGFEEFGYSILAIHLMIYWYSQDSTVTPPVALSAFAAAGIAGSKPFATSLVSWKLSKGLYAIPLLFLSGDILFQNGIGAALVAFVAGLIGLTGLAYSLSRHTMAGPVSVVLAILLFITSVGCFLIDRMIANSAAVITFILLLLAEYLSRRDKKRLPIQDKKSEAFDV